MIGQPVANRPIMIGLLTGDTAIIFLLGKPLGNLKKAKKHFSNLESAGALAPLHRP